MRRKSAKIPFLDPKSILSGIRYKGCLWTCNDAIYQKDAGIRRHDNWPTIVTPPKLTPHTIFERSNTPANRRNQADDFLSYGLFCRWPTGLVQFKVNARNVYTILDHFPRGNGAQLA